MIRLYDRAVRVFNIAATMVTLTLMAVIVTGIASRQLHHAFVWSNEIAIVLFVWLIFLGAGVASGENAHIRVMLLADNVPPAARRTLILAVTYVGALILTVILVNSVYVAYVFRDTHLTTIAVSAVWSWAAVPVGTAMVLAGWIRHGRWTWEQAGTSSEPGREPVI